MAGAVLLRRFFDSHAEQGAQGGPYVKEAVEVMAVCPRGATAAGPEGACEGLRYAHDLQDADPLNCNLSNAYLG